MRKFIITLLFLLPVQAFAGECVVSSSSNKPDARGGLLAALAKVQTGKCETSDEFYRETYGRHFPGSTNYQVVIWKTSMNIELADSLPAISSQSGDPIILRAIDGANVHLKGNGSAKGLKLKDDMIVIENLQISNFAQAGVAMSGEKNIIIASNIHHNKGSGVVLKGKSNKIYSSTIAYNGHSGLELGDEESSSYCQPQSMRILQKTILANNLIHHNEANGLSVDAFSVVVEGGKIHHNGENGIVVNTIGSKIRCQDEGVAIKRADLKTANISKVALYDNEQEQLHISDYPLSAVKNLAISGANSSGSFTVSGLLSFSNDKQMPWHGEVIDFSSLRVDLYLGDENSGGKIYLASAQLAGSSSERFSVELNSEAAEKIQGHTKLVAIVVDTEFGHTSELSASHNIANVSAEADRMDIADDDQDGLANDREDFDGDGFVDRDAGETDPFNPDSDGDGLTDGEERDHIDRIAVLIEQGFPFAALDRLDPNNSERWRLFARWFGGGDS